jgi:hypothetical protein
VRWREWRPALSGISATAAQNSVGRWNDRSESRKLAKIARIFGGGFPLQRRRPWGCRRFSEVGRGNERRSLSPSDCDTLLEPSPAQVPEKIRPLRTHLVCVRQTKNLKCSGTVRHGLRRLWGHI